MAYLRRFPRSPYWFACFNDASGRRVQHSTKQSSRKKAQQMADAWEQAAKLASEKRLGEAQARRILSRIYETLNGEELPSSSTAEFLDSWAKGRTADTAARTQQAYAQVVRDFIKSLGEKANRDIATVSKADVAKYRDSVLRRTSVATANKSLKYLRVALGAAYKSGLSQENPAAKLEILRQRGTERVERRPFTLDELQLIVSNSSGEWKGLILFGLYTGQRLRDIATLTWQNVDLAKAELRFVTGKTGRRMHLPIAQPLLSYLDTLPATDDPAAAVFPNASRLAIKETGESRLSQQFHRILVVSGLAQERTKLATGNGRGGRRTISPISFHSLRHTATSLLKTAGVSEAVAMDIIGHDSPEISRHYTHIEAKAKKDALALLPDLSN